MDIDPAVQPALFLNLSKAKRAEFAGSGHMGAATRLQVDGVLRVTNSDQTNVPPPARRREVARFLGDITASDTAGWYSLISLHGGGSPAATSLEIYRSYPLEDKVALVESLLDRGLLAEPGNEKAAGDQPGRCCADGCQPPEEG